MPSFDPTALKSNTWKLRFVALVAGVAGALIIASRTVFWVAGIPILWPDSWVDRLALLLGPLIGIVGICTGYGLWTTKRWGATAFTAWIALILVHIAVTPVLVAALGGFPLKPTLDAVLLLLLSVCVGVLVIRLVRRWLFSAIECATASPDGRRTTIA